MARSFIWFVSFMQVSSVKVPYHHVSNKGQHGGWWWRNMLEMHFISWSFLVCFCFNYPLIYVQDEWMFGRSSSMLGVNPRRECSFGIGTQCDWEVLEIMPILWWAYALIPHLERWDEKQQGELFFFFEHEALTHLVSPACKNSNWMCSTYVFVTYRDYCTSSYVCDYVYHIWLNI